MALPGDDPGRRGGKPPADDDTYGLSEPVEPVQPPPPTFRPSILESRRSILERAEEPKADRQPRPATTRWPFLVGVFNFPWYLRTFAAWALISIGLVLALVGVVVVIMLADMGFPFIAIRCFAPAVGLVAAITLSYASACATTVIETTVAGYDEVIDWPAGDWREWFWAFFGALTLAGVATAIGFVIGKGLGVNAWAAGGVAVFVLFPIFAFSALESGSPAVLVSWPVLRSFGTVWWAWLFFYLETGVLIGAWVAATAFFFVPHPWLTSLVAGPLLGAVIFIYARLIGRLLWCYGEYGGAE